MQVDPEGLLRIVQGSLVNGSQVQVQQVIGRILVAQGIESPGRLLRIALPRLEQGESEKADNLDRVVGRLLEKSPEDRFQSAAALRQELDRLLSGRRSLLSWIRGRFRELGY